MPPNPAAPSRIRDELDLIDLWKEVQPAVGLPQRTLCFVFLDEDEYILPTLVPMDDLPGEPDAELLSSLGQVLRSSMAGTSAESVVLLLSRPGSDLITAQDRRWSAELDRFSDWPLCLATGGKIQLLKSYDLEQTG